MWPWAAVGVLAYLAYDYRAKSTIAASTVQAQASTSSPISSAPVNNLAPVVDPVIANDPTDPDQPTSNPTELENIDPPGEPADDPGDGTTLEGGGEDTDPCGFPYQSTDPTAQADQVISEFWADLCPGYPDTANGDANSELIFVGEGLSFG